MSVSKQGRTCNQVGHVEKTGSVSARNPGQARVGQLEAEEDM